MRQTGDKIVKILLSCGTAINLYADIDTIHEEMIQHPKFIRFKDDTNDHIFISIEAISGFEVLNENLDTSKEKSQETTPEAV